MSTIAPVSRPRARVRLDPGTGSRRQPSRAGTRPRSMSSSTGRASAERARNVRACDVVRTEAGADLSPVATTVLMIAFAVLVLLALAVAGSVLWQASSPIA